MNPFLGPLLWLIGPNLTFHPGTLSRKMISPTHKASTWRTPPALIPRGIIPCFIGPGWIGYPVLLVIPIIVASVIIAPVIIIISIPLILIRRWPSFERIIPLTLVEVSVPLEFLLPLKRVVPIKVLPLLVFESSSLALGTFQVLRSCFWVHACQPLPLCWYLVVK